MVLMKYMKHFVLYCIFFNIIIIIIKFLIKKIQKNAKISINKIKKTQKNTFRIKIHFFKFKFK